METPNRQYWMGRDGALYADQQAIRRAGGNSSYGRQEAWLGGFLAEQSAEKGRPIRVLDFGVGFGRMAQLLSQRDDVEYYGYDISSAMVAPLLKQPPPLIASIISERVRIGEHVDTVFPQDFFDVIFTVSVLIHNSPEQAADLVSGMRGLLRPGGAICLIENRPVSISMLANQWHAGCWSHDVVGTLALDFDVDVEDGILEEHGIYVLREQSGAMRRVRVPTDDGFSVVSLAEYMLRTKEGTVATVRRLEREITTAALEIGESRDSVELYRQAKARAASVMPQIRDVLSVTSSLPADGHLHEAIDCLLPLAQQLRLEALKVRELGSQESMRQAQILASEQRIEEMEISCNEQKDALAAMSWQLGVRERIARLMRQPYSEPDKHLRPPRHHASALQDIRPVYQFNADRDTRFSQELAGHERVCHVMHQEWFGMRAACGALPGNKLAISASISPRHGEVDEVARLLAAKGVDRIVIHGYSQRMELWIKGLAAVGLGHIVLVWHGAPVMWVHADERVLLESALVLVKSGLIKRIHGMRPGTAPAFGNAAWVPQIYNMPPRYSRREKQRQRRRDNAVVFAPSWNLVHKNLFTNIAAAVATPAVGEVWTLAEEFKLPYATDKLIKHLPKLDQVQMLETMELSDLVTNASIVDCHPMVELEALAAGTPAVRGRLGLDALEDHPYVRLTQVSDPLSIADVRQVMMRILEMQEKDLQEMMSSYSKSLIELSFSRYSELLDI